MKLWHVSYIDTSSTWTRLGEKLAEMLVKAEAPPAVKENQNEHCCFLPRDRYFAERFK